MEPKVTFTCERQPSGQWLGTSPEFNGIVIAERTLHEALEQTGIVLRALSEPIPVEE